MVDISINLKKKGAITAIRKLYKGQDKMFHDLMLKLGRRGQKEIRNQINIWTTNSGFNLPHNTTPSLAQSFILDRLTVSGNVGRISISSDSPYAAYHNTGGIIYGKPFLAIPGARAMAFFNNPPVDKEDLTSQGNFLIKKAKITPKSYLFAAEQELRNKIPNLVHTVIRTDWGAYFHKAS